MNGSTQKVGRIRFFLSNIMFKIFLKLLGVTRTRIRILGSGSVKKFIKTENANANHTKLNANASGSRFLNPDSGIFMRTPDSHRIRTIRSGSPPPDLMGLGLLMIVRVPGIQIIHEVQGMLCPVAGPMPSRSGKSQILLAYQAYHTMFTITIVR